MYGEAMKSNLPKGDKDFFGPILKRIKYVKVLSWLIIWITGLVITRKSLSRLALYLSLTLVILLVKTVRNMATNLSIKLILFPLRKRLFLKKSGVGR